MTLEGSSNGMVSIHTIVHLNREREFFAFGNAVGNIYTGLSHPPAQGHYLDEGRSQVRGISTYRPKEDL